MSNNNFEKTVGPEIAKFGDLRPFFKKNLKKKVNYGQEVLHAHTIDPNKESSKKIFLLKKFLGTEIRKKRVFRDFFKKKECCHPT